MSVGKRGEIVWMWQRLIYSQQLAAYNTQWSLNQSASCQTRVRDATKRDAWCHAFHIKRRWAVNADNEVNDRWNSKRIHHVGWEHLKCLISLLLLQSMVKIITWIICYLMIIILLNVLFFSFITCLLKVQYVRFVVENIKNSFNTLDVYTAC